MTLDSRRFHNALRILRSIDLDEFVVAGVASTDLTGRQGWWDAFNHDPIGTVLRLDDDRFGKLWGLIESRQPNQAESA